MSKEVRYGSIPVMRCPDPNDRNGSEAAVGRDARNGKMLQWITNGSGILIVAYDGTYPGRDGDPYAERILREHLIN
ncbi:hypothetical protein SAMN05444161_9126 [Rhizobiales bacterium GAS191]|nr:hypothetical protein SAMN05444161_9126 [Rhizobiales bacterium GAS191]